MESWKLAEKTRLDVGKKRGREGGWGRGSGKKLWGKVSFSLFKKGGGALFKRLIGPSDFLKSRSGGEMGVQDEAFLLLIFSKNPTWFSFI